ncbi:unnamed protein product [Nesidiocoris tenuis]|uniref:Uncharacterized protein n=1 Tax=Nesidiocoris tenuis TaxID=355587 RepID=A0A6H5H921_9HEMI|nr:unnamed protein product [Nesidiocoris tenuis]
MGNGDGEVGGGDAEAMVSRRGRSTFTYENAGFPAKEHVVRTVELSAVDARLSRKERVPPNALADLHRSGLKESVKQEKTVLSTWMDNQWCVNKKQYFHIVKRSNESIAMSAAVFVQKIEPYQRVPLWRRYKYLDRILSRLCHASIGLTDASETTRTFEGSVSARNRRGCPLSNNKPS